MTNIVFVLMILFAFGDANSDQNRQIIEVLKEYRKFSTVGLSVLVQEI